MPKEFKKIRENVRIKERKSAREVEMKMKKKHEESVEGRDNGSAVREKRKEKMELRKVEARE